MLCGMQQHQDHALVGSLNRRHVVRGAAGLGLGLLFLPGASARGYARNEALDIGVVGVGGRGAANLAGVLSENVVAIADVDAQRLTGAKGVSEAAGRYQDYRRMLDAHALDALVVSTPDHTHAAVSADALVRDLHVYCEKPLTHSVAEARHVTELARARGRVTQMGTQIHAGDNYRRVVEWIQAGVIGRVHTVHVVCGKNWGGDGKPQPKSEVPAHLAYDLWLGPRQGEPYADGYHPAGWRRYWPFGGGTLGDMACHYMDLPFWALRLTAPDRVETKGGPADPFSAPKKMAATWHYPETDAHGEVTMTWSDGGMQPEAWKEHGIDWGNGVLFLGEKGALVADYGRRVLLPAEDFADFEPPAPSIPASIGHYAEWIAACKDGGTPTCTFDYSGPLTETVQLGVVGFRLGRPFRWDAATLTSPDAPEVAALVSPARAEGWELAGS